MSFGFLEHAFWSRGTLLLASQTMLLGYLKGTSWSPEALLPRGLSERSGERNAQKFWFRNKIIVFLGLIWAMI